VSGNDNLSGGAGADFHWGEAGGYVIAGNDEKDPLVEGTGTDRLTGGPATDNPYGNFGADADGVAGTFVFTPNWGTGFVYDFGHGADLFDMSALGIQFADLTVTDSGANAQIAPQRQAPGSYSSLLLLGAAMPRRHMAASAFLGSGEILGGTD
jgi:hypothetical protein